MQKLKYRRFFLFFFFFFFFFLSHHSPEEIQSALTGTFIASWTERCVTAICKHFTRKGVTRARTSRYCGSSKNTTFRMFLYSGYRKMFHVPRTVSCICSSVRTRVSPCSPIYSARFNFIFYIRRQRMCLLPARIIEDSYRLAIVAIIFYIILLCYSDATLRWEYNKYIRTPSNLAVVIL